MVKGKSLDFFAASILLIFIYVYVHPLDAGAISVNRGQFSRRVATAICAVIKKYATSNKIQPPLNDPSKFPKEEAQPCQRLQWKTCGGGDCQRFELKGCPGPQGSKSKVKTRKLKAKIVGGTDAEPHEFPHQVIFYIPLPYDEFGRCGGSVLNKNYILSAAHCFYERSPEGIVVTAGDYDITQHEGTEQNRTIKSIIMHEGYVEKTKLNDIALLKLNQPLDLTPQVRPVLLADKKFVIPEMATVTGWGSLHYGGELDDLMVMQRVDVPIVLWQECEKNYKDDRIKIFPTNICAGAEDRDACQGDSGGPLTFKDAKGQYNQIGIVSFGFGCGFPNYPGVYTLIPEYIDWINKNSKE